MTEYALVTAGAQGLGAAICEALAERGYTVLAHAHRDQGRLPELRARFGAQIQVLQADLSVAKGRAELAEAARAQTESLAVLVHNLGVYPEVELLELSLSTWEQTLELSCTAAFDLTRLLLPALSAAQPAARIVTIGDSGADRIEARRWATPYHVAKLGLHVLTRSYAQALAPQGITVNMISPGFLKNSVGEPGELLPTGPGEYSDVTGALSFLLSPEGAAVSGANLLAGRGYRLG